MRSKTSAAARWPSARFPSEISADDAIACLSELAERLKIARSDGQPAG